MDVQHILGLAMVLYFVVFSIVDHFHPQSCDDPDREPVTAPPPSTPPVRRAEYLTRKRIELMKKRNLGHLLLTDYRFTDKLTEKDMTSPENIREKLNAMLREMMVYLNLPPTYTVDVIPDEDWSLAPDRGAECAFACKKINFFLRSQYTPEQLVSMLVHECAHYVCHFYGMYEYKVFMVNEWNTDIVACLMGFSKYMLIPNPVTYLKTEQLKMVRWMILQERKALSPGSAEGAA